MPRLRRTPGACSFAMGSGRCLTGVHFNGDVRQPFEALENRVIEPCRAAYIGGNGDHRAHMACSYLPHMLVDNLVATVL